MSDRTIPTSEEIRNNGNHLKDEPSLYLRQHAHNPLNWYPWGEEALSRAKEENKPIFLSIGYSSCHWCHVMEHEVFEKDAVAEYMNQHFISIKVDREERPDLDAMYMKAVQAMTGGGGWPMTVFLTPDQEPVFGGTYFPEDRFMQIAQALLRLFAEDPSRLQAQADQLRNIVSALPELNVAQGYIDQAGIAKLVDRAMLNFDDRWGGMSSQMKFPTPLRWHFLLHYYRKTGNERIARMLQLTLDKMASGGIHDHIAGGFHRYTVEQTWLIPHFEKMLYDNAQLASLYIEAGVVFGNERYSEVGCNTLEFLIWEMREPGGAFYGSFDADSDGEEGTYYTWSPDEFIKLFGQQKGNALAMLLGVTDHPNFEGKSVLTRRVDPAMVAEELDLDIDEIKSLFADSRDTLRDFRNKRVAPTLDKKIVTSWNGLTIATLAQAALVKGNDSYSTAAEEAANYLWNTHRKNDGSLYRTSTDGICRGEGNLDDYVFLANGMLELFRTTQNIQWLERAKELTDYVIAHFVHEEGGYFSTSDLVDSRLGRQYEINDSVEPSGNSMMVQVLIRLAALTGQNRYHQLAEKSLTAVSHMLERGGLDLAWWLDAAFYLNGPFYEMIIVSDSMESAHEFRKAYGSLLPAYSVLTMVDDSGAELLKPAEGKMRIGKFATAYVCQHGSCKMPTEDVQQMLSQLQEGWDFGLKKTQ